VKPTTDSGVEVHRALDTLWKVVTADYRDDGVEFLRGFVKPK
jgi:hypothetical protein